MFEWIMDPNAWLALGTLIILEIILGVDNIIFLSMVVSRLPKAQQSKARRLGLGAAMLMRMGLLASITWVIQLTKPLFKIVAHSISVRDLIFLLGGIFLIWKASKEILEITDSPRGNRQSQAYSFLGSLIQIMLLDIIFSLDSVITAVCLSDHLFIMTTAVVSAVGAMMYAAEALGDFVNRHLSVKVLSLAFLILIGFTLMLESLQIHVPKAYIYFAMLFSVGVEALNLIRIKKGSLSG